MPPDLRSHPKYILGIDLGASAIGWALINLNDLDHPKSLIDTGVRIFKAGVKGSALEIQEGEDESNALIRRTARLRRRQIRRRAYRQEKLFQLLQEQGLLPKSSSSAAGSNSEQRHKILNFLDLQLNRKWNSDSTQSGFSELPLYLLRRAALDQKLEPYEVGRIFYHLSQRRGFKSNRRECEKGNAEELGAVKAGIAEFAARLKLSGARTLGEYLAGLDPHQSGQNVRRRWTERKMYEDEFAKIWEKQASYDPTRLNESLRKAVSHWLFFQRPMASQSHLIGECELEGSNYHRAAWATLEAQLFRVLQNVNDLEVIDSGTLVARPLTLEERKLIIKLLDRDGDKTFGGIRRALKLDKKSKFNLERGDERVLRGNRTNRTMLSVFGDRWDLFSADEKRQIVEDWRTIESEETLVRRCVMHWGLNEIEAQQLAADNPENGYCALSCKAIRRLLPLMLEGMSYKDAKSREYGGCSRGEQVLEQLPPLHVRRKFTSRTHSDRLPSNFQISPSCNPSLQRALTEMRKIVNAVVRKYGKPHEVCIELTRELKKTREERKHIAHKNRLRKKTRDLVKAALQRECGIQNPSRADIEKALLHAECGGICAYSGRTITLNQLFGESPEFDVEHIIPISRYPDDSFQNKTLRSIREKDRLKRTKTLFEEYEVDSDRWREMLLRIKAWKPGNPGKFKRFALRNEDELTEFILQQMSDTRHASTLVSRILESLYGGREVETPTGTRQVLFTSSGSVTATLRRNWGLEHILREAMQPLNHQHKRDPRSDYRHHAIDAITIALARHAVVRSMSCSAYLNPSFELDHQALGKITSPWPQFVKSISPHIDAIVVSHRPEHKMSGPLHDETNYGKPYIFNGKTMVHIRKPVSELSANDIRNIADPAVRVAVAQKAESMNGLLSKCESTNNWPVLQTRNGQPVPIKRVRVCKVLGVRAIAERERQRFVAVTNNHHIAIFEFMDEKREIKWEGVPVSLFAAMERKRKKQAPVNHCHPNGDAWRFQFSLMGGDTIELHRKCLHEKSVCAPEIYRIRSIATNGQLSLAKINDARTKKEIQEAGEWWCPKVEALRKLDCRKVSIDPLGKVHQAKD